MAKQFLQLSMIKIKITDNTVVPVSAVELNQSEIAFEIVRTLEGNRKNPKGTFSVTPSVRLYETITPEYADNKEVTWSVGDGDMLRVDGEDMMSVREDARWIADLIQAEKTANKKLAWSVSDSSVVSVSDSGLVTANSSGQWIKDLEAANQYGASEEKEATVTVTTDDGGKQALCHVKVTFKTTNQTTSSNGGSSSGGGGSSSGGSSSSSRVTAGTANGPGAAGTWIQDAIGWWYQWVDGGYPKSSWQQLSYSGATEWYHFDENGYMQTGWFTDIDGHINYLHPVGDGIRGRMYTGWNLIDGNWYYFNTVSDGTRGALFVNCQTPDGYRVDEKGVWIP